MDNCLKEGIYWIGYVDWDVRNFHGYITERGSTYNSYLVMDEKIAVIDTVKAPYGKAMIKHLQAYTEPAKVDYLVCNHVEPDHSGEFPQLVKLCSNAEVVCNAKCQKNLSLHYDVSDWKFKIVDEETVLSLGKRTLRFVDTPMAHWPESMCTYVAEEKLLFSMDAFGQHYASSARFDDQVPLDEVMHEATKYYANIIMLYGKPVLAALEKAATIEIEMIAPSHGVIWRKNLGTIIGAYQKWAVCKAEPKVLIFYDSMWKSTAMMAEAIYEGANKPGIRVKKHDLKSATITEIATEVIDCAVMAVGTPTLNKGMMPKVAEILCYLKGLAPTGKAAMAFGSYGWAKKGGQHEVHEYLKTMNCEMLDDEPIQSQFVPTPETIEKCRKAGEMLAEEALKRGK